MLASALITLREGLEAALIVGVVLAVLQRVGRSEGRRPVWAGVLTAAIVSVIAGLILNGIGLALEGRAEELFEGWAMLLAAAVLTWMIFWMGRQGSQIQVALEEDVRRAVRTGSGWALFGLAFFAVVREGIETVLFLTASAMGSTAAQTLTGGAIGLVAALLVGWLIFVVGKRLNFGLFFRVTSVLLILVAAGLVAHGVHELQEAALLPVVVEHVWDINRVLDENSVGGTFLKSLLGYNGNPSLLEVLAYGAYLMLVVLVGLARGGESRGARRTAGGMITERG